MTTIEKIAFWTIWIMIIIAKIPIAIASAIILGIEKFVTWVQMRLAEWSGDDEIIDGANTGIDINVAAWDSYRDDILDMKIEL